MVLRYLLSIFGSGIVGTGVGICVLTGMGADALGVLWEGLAYKLSISVGQASLIVTSVCLVLVLLINKKELGLATLLNPLTTSLLTDLSIKQIQLPTGFWVNLLFLTIGISLIGLGSGVAAATNTGKEGYIALSFSISQKSKLPLSKVRIILDCCCFVFGMILGGKFMVGPIIGIFLIGPLLQRSTGYCSERFALL